MQITSAMIGKRIEIPVHYDMWARGARVGTISSICLNRDPRDAGYSSYVNVKMDHPQVKRRLKVWRLDLDYVRWL